MSNKRIEIDLMFQANTQQAINNIQQLGILLNNISTKTKIGFDDGPYAEAAKSAQQLSMHLQNAVNQDTGKINLTKLNQSLKSSGTNLQVLSSNIAAVGPAGQQAFMKLANAIASAETPMIRIGDKMKDFITSLANTAKWQIASTAIHGFQGMIQSAVGHAKNLDKALNDIRIVTGYTAKDMEDFAIKASQAAKALNSTTTEYAKAALIFYQQGLSGNEVEERADTVIKLSQVTGESAETVSSQMTAIWNNFDDGSKSLEYYADVLTKLGAATAASTDEISNGLEKFAAVADTVGLSYEYAAASVATVVDKTQQSAEVVGTSFKTIFARMQGLSLGETLEDGVDLNKYSEALEKVGIKVLDAKGEMRDMDDILNDLGSKWNTFGKATQTAIAQTVGGIRQYNQMIALMDNWDSVVENIELAKKATGELAEQQAIWSESYEAAAKRVEQAKNELYEKFIDDDSLIKLTDSFAKLIDMTTNFIDNLGGIRPIVTMLIGLFGKFLFPILQTGFIQLRNNIDVLTGRASKEIQAVQNNLSSEISNKLNTDPTLSSVQRQQLEITQQLLSSKRQLEAQIKTMTVAQQEEARLHYQNYEAMASEVQKGLERKAQLEEENRLIKERLNGQQSRLQYAETSALSKFRGSNEAFTEEDEDIIIDIATGQSMSKTQSQIDSLGAWEAEERKKFEKIKEEIEKEIKKLQADFGSLSPEGKEGDQGQQILKQIAEHEKEITDQEKKLNEEIEKRTKHLEKALELQEEILELQTTGTPMEKMSFGEAETNTFSKYAAAKPNKKQTVYQKSTLGAAKHVTETLQADNKEAASMSDDGVITATASLENLEKLYSLKSEYLTLSSQLNAIEEEGNIIVQQRKQLTEEQEKIDSSVGALAEQEKKLKEALSNGNLTVKERIKKQKELRAIQKQLANEEKKQQKITEQLTQADKKFISILEKSEKEITVFARKLGVSEGAIKKLSKAFKKFKEDPEKGFKNLSNELKNLKTVAEQADLSIEDLALSMAEELMAGGMNEDDLNAFINNLRNAGFETEGLERKIRAMGSSKDELDELNQKVSGLTETFEVLSSSIGYIQMMSSGLNSLADAFDSGASASEKFQSIITGLSMTLPAVIGLYKLLTAQKLKDNLATSIGNLQKEKEILLEGAKTAKTWLLIAAKSVLYGIELALKWLTNPVYAAMAVAAIAGVIAITAALTKSKEKQLEAEKQAAEATAEGANKSREMASTLKEESNAVEELIKKYRELKNAKEGTFETENEILEDGIELAGQYRDAIKEFSKERKESIEEDIADYEKYIRTGQYEKALETQRNIQNAINNKILWEDTNWNEANKASAVQKDSHAAAITVQWNLNKSLPNFADEWGWTRIFGEDIDMDSKSYDILSEAELEGIKLGGDSLSRGILDFNFSTAYDSVNTLQSIEEAIKILEKNDISPEDGIYKVLKGFLDATKQSYGVDYKDARQQVMTARGDYYSGKGISELTDNTIDNYKDYRNVRGYMIDATEYWTAEDVDRYLGEQSEYNQYTKADARVKLLEEQTNDNGTVNYQKKVNEMSEEQFEAFLNADLSRVANEAQLDEVLEKEREKIFDAQTEQVAKDEGLDTEEFQAYVDLLAQANSEMREMYDGNEEDYRKALNEIAKANKKMERGVKSLADNWEDFDDIMSDSTSTAEDISIIAPKIKTALQDILNLDTEEFNLLPEDFVQKNWGLIQDVVNGVEGSVDELRNKAGEGILLTVEGVLDPNGNLKEDFAGLHEAIASFDNSEFAVGIALDKTAQADFYANCQAIIEAAGMTAEQAQAYFGSMGYNVEFTNEPKTVIETVWDYTYDNQYDDQNNLVSKKVNATPRVLEGTVEVPVIETITPNGSYGGGIGVNTTAPKSATSKSGGGGGSKPKKAKETKKSDVVERYKEVEDSLDNVRDAQDKASKSADRLYGAARLKEMNKISKALQKQIQLLKEKKKEAEAYLKLDKAELEKVSAQVGISFNFDSETGDITNYTSEMTKLYNKLHDLEVSANADGNVTEAEQEAIDKVNEDIDLVEEARKQYEDTMKTKEEIEQAIQDAINEQQDINFEKLNYKFELKMEIPENSLKWIDYQLGKLEDDFYSAAEAAALFFDISNQEGTKYGQTLEQVKMTTQQFAEAEKMYNTFDKDGNRLISQANYIEAMNQARDSYYDQLSALQEIDDAMMEYYSNTLDKASEELAKYTDQMEHLSGVLEHYNSLMTLMGKEKDYKTMGVVLDGQLKVAEDKLAVSESTYQMYAAEVKKYEDDIENGVYASMTDAEKELFDKEYQAALQKAGEAEEEFLSNAEATVEAWKAKMQNELDGFGKDLEEALTGGTSFDWLTTTMERMNSLHEEYLTTTNKIYETNKLMNQVQKEIDKSSNSIAKRKLKDFIEQTKSLQDQTALSKFELDIQKAKYDLLLAEIALEEAQNAKSQVRLQRDSEGNFGYVYTADSSAIDDAQQKLQDAQNNLYNVSLEGANKYAEQEVQIRSEMYDTLRELETQYMEGSFASLQEYETAKNEAMAYYYDKLEQASNFYNVAISADASASAEHILGQEYLVAQTSFGTFGDIARDWQSRLKDMKNDTDLWKKDIVGYVGNVISKFEAWEKFCAEMSKRTSLTDLATQVGNITEKSEELRQKVTDPTNGVIKALSDEFEAVQKVTGEYGKQRETIQGLITDIENYIKALDDKQKAEVGDLDKEEEEEKQEEKQETSSDTSDTNTKQEANELATTTKELVEKIHRGEIGKPGQGWKSSARAAGYSEDAIELALKAINESKQGAGYGYYYNKALELLDSYDTGGYTGDWDGSYGKLAMVHKKELILKEGDTANFLASMEVLERILSIIDLQSANAQYVGTINSPALKSTGQDILEQNVHIEASFPNATDKNEIEEAFKNIVNLASQYANRK